MAIFDGQQKLTNHLDGGGVGHPKLLRVIGEEFGGRGRDLPGSGGGLSVEVSLLTCQSHKRDFLTVNQKIVIDDLWGQMNWPRIKVMSPIGKKFLSWWLRLS